MILVGISIYTGFYPELNNMEKMIPLLVSSLVTIIGFYIPGCKQNYFFGVKTPWTLANEVVWDKTHHVTGPILVFCGLLSTTVMLMFNINVAMGVFTACFAAVILLPTIYSAIIKLLIQNYF